VLSRAAAWHNWSPSWIPSRIAVAVRRTALRRYQEAVLCELEDGLRFVAHPSDLLPCLVGTTGGWEHELMNAVKPLVRAGEGVLDIGAHVGYTAIRFAQWVGATGRVYAFEPVPAHRDQLMRNLEVNDFAARVAVIPLAVSDRSGSLPFYDSHRSNTGMSSLSGRRGATASRQVETCAIDEWLPSAGVPPLALAKIDVEGAELLVVRGMMRTLVSTQIRAVLIELHRDVAPAVRHEIGAFFAQLPVGYTLFGWHPSGEFRAEPVDAPTDYLLAVHRDWAGEIRA